MGGGAAGEGVRRRRNLPRPPGEPRASAASSPPPPGGNRGSAPASLALSRTKVRKIMAPQKMKIEIEKESDRLLEDGIVRELACLGTEGY